MTTIRLFFAIDPGDELRAWSRALLERCRRGVPKLRWVSAENIHVTLCFLGDVESDRTDALLEVARRVAADCPLGRIRVRPCELGSFGPPRSPRAVWLGLGEPEGESGALEVLIALHRALERGLETLGFAAESRPWTPHLTLARGRRGVKPGPWRERLRIDFDRALQEAPDIVFRTITLFSSELTPGGSIYRAVGAAPLGSS